MSIDIGTRFRALHQPGNPFILANAWDVGSAKMLAALGAEAIGTSSAAYGFTKGQPDGGLLTRDAALTHASDLAAAVKLPVSGDFENGFGDAPETCAETVRLSVEAGLAGLSIEDTALPGSGFYAFDHAVERIRAAADAARAAPKDIVLCARADGVLTGSYDLEEAIRRVQAFANAGADCVYIPTLGTLQDLARITGSVSVPVNALVVGPFTHTSRAEFGAIGIGRISLGSTLARATHRVVHDAAVAMFGHGDFTPLATGISGDDVDALLDG